ncbi:MAG TPA: hypothetical protein VIW73_08885 [Candidatus Cybelea sp.]
MAPVYGQAEIAYRRLKVGLPSWMYQSHESRLTLTLPNGACLWFKGADKPATLYGEDVFAAVIDEASRTKPEAYHAVRSTLTATRGPLRLIGNVKGRRNWMFEVCRKAEAGMPDWGYYRIIAADAVAAGVLADDEIAAACRELPEAVFRELYLAEASDDQGNPFGFDYIRAALAEPSGKPVSAWGIDLGKAVDWTVLTGLDDFGAIAKQERFRAPWPETMQRIRTTVGTRRALVDSTGLGDPIVELLQKELGSNYEGYLFSAPSKQKLMEGLAVAVQSRETTILEGAHRQEMESFEYQYTRTGVRYSAPAGYHDDTVCSHALAVACRGRDTGLEAWWKLAGGRPQ